MIAPIYPVITQKEEEIPTNSTCKYSVKINDGVYTCAQNEQEFQTALEMQSKYNQENLKYFGISLGIIILVLAVAFYFANKND